MCLEGHRVEKRGKVKTSVGSNWHVCFGVCVLFGEGVFFVSVVSDFVCVCVPPASAPLGWIEANTQRWTGFLPFQCFQNQGTEMKHHATLKIFWHRLLHRMLLC